MHPIIRLLSLLVFAALAPWLPGFALLAAGLLLLAGSTVVPGLGPAVWRAVRRIRWLLLSLAVLDLWFSPGAPLLPMLGSASPTATGLALAGRHAGVLLIMVCAVAALLSGLQPGEVTAALRALFMGPLRNPRTLRFADRAGLLLMKLPKLEQRVRSSVRQQETGIVGRAAALFRAVEADAGTVVEAEPLSLPPVPRAQWLLPPSLLVTGLLCVFPPESFR